MNKLLLSLLFLAVFAAAPVFGQGTMSGSNGTGAIGGTAGPAGASGATSLGGLSDVTVTSPAEHEILTYTGAGFENEVVRTGSEIHEIYAVTDFPTAVGGVITLTDGLYCILESFSMSDRFLVAGTDNVAFHFPHSRGTTLTYTGTDPFFTSTSTGRIAIVDSNILLSGNSVQVFDITNSHFTYDTGLVVFSGSSTSIGTVTDGQEVLIKNLTMIGFQDGITFTDVATLFINELFMQSDHAGTGSFCNIIGSLVLFGTAETMVAVLSSGESIFYIDPAVKTNINITDVINTNGGSFFQASSKSGVIASIADLNQSAVSVTAVADAGGGVARFSSATHGLAVGETVIHTTFADSAYNGTHVITAVAASTYDIGTITYTATGTGLYAANTVEVTDVAHGLVNGDTVMIDGTIDYDDGFTVFNKGTDTFEITAVFVATETGTWSNASQTQQTKYVTTFRNGPQKDSVAHGEGAVGGNVTATTVSLVDTFYDLNLGASGLASSADIELWTITNATTGEMRYDGLTPINLHFNGIIAASSSGGTDRYNFRLLKNGSPLPSPDNVDIPVEIKAAVISSSVLWTSAVATGDLFRIQVENASSDRDITIDTLKIQIIGN